MSEERARKRSNRGETQEKPDMPDPSTKEGRILRSAARAFEAGDYATVAALTVSLRSHDDPSVGAYARVLHRATEIDPVAKIVTLGCALLFLAVVLIYGS